MEKNVVVDAVSRSGRYVSIPKSDKVNAFELSIDELVLAANSLYDGIPITMNTLSKVFTRSRKTLRDFVDTYRVEAVDEADGTPMFKLEIPNVKKPKFDRLREHAKRADHAVRAVSEGFLVTLVTQFDTFIGSLARAVLNARPDTLNASEKMLTFSELKSFATLDDARTFLLDKEVDELLRGSHTKQIEWFQKRLKKGRETQLVSQLGPWAHFIEITERRNVFIHADGVATKQYVEECQKAGLSIGEFPPVGARLTMPHAYYKHAYAVVVEVGVRLGQLMWTNTESDNADYAVNRLIDLNLDFLNEQHSGLAGSLLEFGTELATKYGDESTKKTMAINLCQAYKWQGNEDSMKRALAAFDFSASDDAFLLGKAVLEDNWEAIDRYMRRLAKLEDLHPNCYREWPLFQKLRKDDRFLALFEELFGEALLDSDTEDSSEAHETQGIVRALTLDGEVRTMATDTERV